MNKNHLLGTLFMFLSSISAFAQDAEMADTMRSEGKIYVVVAIVVLILLGLVGYLILLDRKVTGIEKKLTKK